MVGADRYRNPDEDLPGDFDNRREDYYGKLTLPSNAGLKRIAAGRHGVPYKELLHTRRRYVDKAFMRDAICRVVNTTMAVRAPDIWGEGTTACAYDSTKFGAWDQNFVTEWHAR